MRLLTRWPREQLFFTDEERQQAVDAVEKAFASALETLKVDIGLVDLLEQIYIPLGAWLARKHGQHKAPLVIGINGAQGAGKSTLFNLLEVTLSEGFGLNVVGFSIDDLYKTRQGRQQLAEDVHPLLVTRGVPGTHDVELGCEIVHSLKNSDDNTVTKIPVFDKSIDDRCSQAVWQEWVGPADIIVMEGWCVGAQPQDQTTLHRPVNALEEVEDPDVAWREYVNQQLKGSYKQLFELVDVLIMLKVPSMDAVFQWRSQQEAKLAERAKYIYDTQQPTPHLRIMNEQEIQRFIQHYERLTRHMLEEMPGRADITLLLNNNHKVADIQINSPVV